MEALRRKGENVSSLELEAAIRSLAQVAEVAVIAVPSVSEDEIKARPNGDAAWDFTALGLTVKPDQRR